MAKEAGGKVKVCPCESHHIQGSLESQMRGRMVLGEGSARERKLLILFI